MVICNSLSIKPGDSTLNTMRIGKEPFHMKPYKLSIKSWWFIKFKPWFTDTRFIHNEALVIIKVPLGSIENSYFFFKFDSFYIQTPIDKDNDSYKLKDNKNSSSQQIQPRLLAHRELTLLILFLSCQLLNFAVIKDLQLHLL